MLSEKYEKFLIARERLFERYKIALMMYAHTSLKLKKLNENSVHYKKTERLQREYEEKAADLEKRLEKFTFENFEEGHL